MDENKANKELSDLIELKMKRAVTKAERAERAAERAAEASEIASPFSPDIKSKGGLVHRSSFVLKDPPLEGSIGPFKTDQSPGLGRV